MSSNNIVIVGAGETAAIAFEYFSYDSEYEVAGFSVERDYLESDVFLGLPVIPLDRITEQFPPDQFLAFVAVSSTKLNRVRTRLFRGIKQRGYTCPSYISSRAFLWKNVQIGENCFIFENNTIQPFVKIGDNVVLWSGNHIGHNSIIRDNCFITSHVVISGFCDIGENSFLGVNSTIINNVKIARDCFIGAGALIQKNSGAGKVYQSMSTPASRVDSLRLFRLKE